jgi:hypothetical protein
MEIQKTNLSTTAIYQNGPTYSYGSASSNNYYPFPQIPIAFNPHNTHRQSPEPIIEPQIKRRFCPTFKNVKATGE